MTEATPSKPTSMPAAPTLAVVMDPISEITYYKDTTLALLLAAQARGFQLLYAEMDDLYSEQGVAMARLRPLTVYEDGSHWFDLGEPEQHRLGSIDCILMRKDPPFDNQYIYATYMLEQAENEGSLVVNKPQSLRDCNEKFFATRFPQCCPPVVVSSNKNQLRSFHQRHGDVIFKPLDGMGGSSIFRCRADDPNVSVIIETLTEHGRNSVMAQRFIPDISNGDKRITSYRDHRGDSRQFGRWWPRRCPAFVRSRPLDCGPGGSHTGGKRAIIRGAGRHRRLSNRNQRYQPDLRA